MQQIESDLDKKGNIYCKKNNIYSIKLGLNGLPDRLYISQKTGKIAFIELKRQKSSKRSSIQQWWVFLLNSAFKNNPFACAKFIYSWEELKKELDALNSN